MLLLDVKMRKILQTLGLLDICFSGLQMRALRLFLLQRDIRQLKMFYNKRQFPFFPSPNMNTMSEVLVVFHPRGTAEGEGAGATPAAPPRHLTTGLREKKAVGDLGYD